MSLYMATIASTIGLLAILGEWLLARRERRIRAIMEQPLAPEDREQQRLYKMLFVTSILALFVALGIASVNRFSFSIVQGVAVVIDTRSLPADRDPAHQLSIQKAAAAEVVRALPGTPLSLYELRGGTVHLVVPPTVDRLFFELQLDGILSSPSTVRELTLDAIYDDVTGRFSGPPPWVVVVSATALKPGRTPLDGAVHMAVHSEGAVCSVYDSRGVWADLGLDKAALMMRERLTHSAMPVAPDSVESLILVACTGLAWLCFLLWRRAVVPLYALGLFLAACPHLLGITDIEANAMARSAIDLAQAQEYEASHRAIDMLLTSVVDPKARQRLLYDKALLSYLQGKETEALQWLDMLSEKEEPEPAALRGLTLVRLVSASPHDEQRHWQSLLHEWLRTNPNVSKEILAAAALASAGPALQQEPFEAVRHTLRWLEEHAREVPQPSSLTVAASLIAQQQNTMVEALLNSWPEEVRALFSRDMEKTPLAISAIRIWYDFACAPTKNEAIASLVSRASEAAHRVLFFPDTAAADTDDIAVIEAILARAVPQSQPWLLEHSSGDLEQRAAFWYARAMLWPALQQEPSAHLKAVTLLLCQEVDRPSSPAVQTALAALVGSVSSLPSHPTKAEVSLTELLPLLLTSWYLQDPDDALDAVLAHTNDDPDRWAPRLYALIVPPLHEAKAPLPAAMARGVGDEIEALDPVITGRLWQVAQAPVATPQEVKKKVDNLLKLFAELSSRLSTPQDHVLRSMILLFSLQPLVADELRNADIFHSHPAKRARYDQLLKEWNDVCVDIQQRIAEPATFRLPKVQQQIDISIATLRRLRALLSESDEQRPLPEEQVPRTAGVGKRFSIRGEDAIRLFQKMDRADRELYGG